MKPLITLTRKLRTSRWTFVGDVAFSVKRSWELSILRLSAERRYVDEATVNEQLLGGGRLSVAERLLGIIRDFRLLDQHGGLTEDGRRALERGEILVPQRGAWEVLLAEDEPLIRNPLLRISPAKEPSAFDEVKDAKQRQQSPPPLLPLPASLSALAGVDTLPALDEEKRIRIDFDSDGRLGRAEPSREALKISLHFDPAGQPRLEVGEKSLSGPLAVDREAVWWNLLSGAGLDKFWNANRQALGVRFDELTDAERRDRARTIRFESPTVGGLGTFDSLEVGNVPLIPLSASDAQKWAEWRLLNSLGDVATNVRFNAWWEDARKPFSDFTIRQPERAALAASGRTDPSKKPDARYWRLQAALDFAL